MKTTKMMIVSGALFMMISCDNTERDNERKEAKDDLKSFVDSVDRVADERTDHNWTDLDRRYSNLEQRAETAYMNAEEEDLEDLREIQVKYEEAKIEGKKKEFEMNEKSEMHLSRVETWRESRTTSANRNTSEDIDDTVKESIDWLEDNFEKLGNDIRARYERIRADVKPKDG
ncbi:hypothetical protein [Aquiflexum sp.]|uniref:hypothetical protein n=1 Tax=Aquiflexum sp. TaxID=1872584 RepID=UPI00359480C7